MAQADILERFCTPTAGTESGADGSALSGAEAVEISFEGERLAAYTWGSGPNVLLAHGWGSRAAHLALLARVLAQAGYRVTAFDGPAHGRSRKTSSPNQSSLFEQCRALSSVAATLGPIHAVVGHSLGAAAAAFTLAGHGLASPYKFSAERLVMVSCPPGIAWFIGHFCADSGERDRAGELQEKLQNAFGFKVEDYVVSDVMDRVDAGILIVHDENDEYISVEDARRIRQARADAKLVLTQGSGHQKILVSRAMLRAVKEFLAE
jgi:pimeloyl-ACP methyl ester carboxylesterase